MDEARTLGGRLRQARHQLALRTGGDVSKSAVAKRVGVTSMSVGRWEEDKQEPTLAMIAKLAAALQVDPRWLAYGSPGAVVHGTATPEAGTTPPTGVPVAPPHPETRQESPDWYERIDHPGQQPATPKRRANGGRGKSAS